jgi:probable F420-dependent oxidoreductase
LNATSTLCVATGIACIYDYPARVIGGSQRVLYDQSDGRFLLGLGVSHKSFVEGVRRAVYGPPLPTMRTYLGEMDACAAATDEILSATRDAGLRASLGEQRMPRVIAALGPQMLDLAREACDGAHPYLVTPEHTNTARAILGPDPWLCVEQKVVREIDPARARTAARRSLEIYLSLPNYLRSWKRLGFEDSDFADGGSDRLVDALFAWGDDAAIRRRLDDHLAAGATQLCVQALPVDGRAASGVEWETLHAIADMFSLR